MRPIYNSVDMVDATAVVIVLVGSRTQPIMEFALECCVYDSCEAGSCMQQFLRMISSEVHWHSVLLNLGISKISGDAIFAEYVWERLQLHRLLGCSPRCFTFIFMLIVIHDASPSYLCYKASSLCYMIQRCALKKSNFC
jgi:hypothetical protein